MVSPMQSIRRVSAVQFNLFVDNGRNELRPARKSREIEIRDILTPWTNPMCQFCGH